MTLGPVEALRQSTFDANPLGSMQTVVLYTRPGCHLCEAAHTFLEAERTKRCFDLQIVNIDADAALQASFGNEVPVVSIDGKTRFRGKINPVLWSRLLAD